MNLMTSIESIHISEFASPKSSCGPALHLPREGIRPRDLAVCEHVAALRCPTMSWEPRERSKKHRRGRQPDGCAYDVPVRQLPKELSTASWARPLGCPTTQPCSIRFGPRPKASCGALRGRSAREPVGRRGAQPGS